jgi:hypothetical protein
MYCSLAGRIVGNQALCLTTNIEELGWILTNHATDLGFAEALALNKHEVFAERLNRRRQQINAGIG